MKPIIVFSLLLFVHGRASQLRAQRVTPAEPKTVLILLRQPEGSIGKRLAELPASTSVPDEVREAAVREQAALAQAQQESFAQRMTAAGVTQLVYLHELNMVRGAVPATALSAVKSDPAVVSVTPLSEDAPVFAGVTGAAAGAVTGVRGFKSEALQLPALAPTMPSGAVGPIFPPGTQMPLPGTQMPGLPGSGGMLQSLLGVTGQMGMQAGAMMPRAAGAAVLFSGAAQIAQAVLASRKQVCAINMVNAGAAIPEAGGSGTIAVDAPASCFWRAQSEATWLQLNQEGPMLGPGVIKYTAVAASPGMLRTGVIHIVGAANGKVKGQTSLVVRQGQ